MKKIFKLFLCLLMFISFTNVTRVFAEEEGEYVDVEDVFNNYMNTNYMRALLIELAEDDEASEYGLSLNNIDMQMDKTNHKIYMTSNGETFMTLDYNDEYISFSNQAPATEEEATQLGLKYFIDVLFGENWVYSVLDTMGYEDVDIEIEGENDEDELDEEFFNQYGIMLTEDSYSFEGHDGENSYGVVGSYIKEFRMSLNRAVIAGLVEAYGVERPDYYAMATGEVVKPEITVKKKNTAISVSWKEDYNATKYIVYRATSKTGTFTKLATVTDKTSYTDKNVTYGKAYYYKVRVIGEKNRVYSDVKGLKLKPAQVQNVKISAVKTNSVKVSWNKEPENGYVVERSTDNKKWTAVKTITKNTTVAYTDKGLKANKRYYYRVRAYKTVGRTVVYGPYSAVTNVVTGPAAPTFKVSTDTSDSLKLTITEVKGAVKYDIFRSTKKTGTYTKVDETDYLTYVDEYLSYGKTYYYKVRACNSYGRCGNQSAAVSGKVALKKPGIKIATPTDAPLSIKVINMWGVDGAEIYRSTSEKGTYKLIKTLSFMDDSYEDTGAQLGKTYYYKARTYAYVNGYKKYSEYSAIKSGSPKFSSSGISLKEVQSINEFNGVYTKGGMTVKIYSTDPDIADVYFTSEEYDGTFDLAFVDGKLVVMEKGYDDIVIQKTTDNGLYVSGLTEVSGVYTLAGEYTLDDYFEDNFGSTEYLNSAFSGRFEASDGGYINLYQSDATNVYIAGELKDSWGVYLDDLTINGNIASTYLFEDLFEVEATETGIIFRYTCADDAEQNVTVELTKVSDATKEFVIQNFF